MHQYDRYETLMNHLFKLYVDWDIHAEVRSWPELSGEVLYRAHLRISSLTTDPRMYVTFLTL